MNIKKNQLSDINRGFIANVIYDLIITNDMFSIYDIYAAVRDELSEIENYKSIKRELIPIIDSIIADVEDYGIVYVSDYVSRNGKVFAVYHNENDLVEDYMRDIVKVEQNTIKFDEAKSDINIERYYVDNPKYNWVLNIHSRNRIHIPKSILDVINKNNNEFVYIQYNHTCYHLTINTTKQSSDDHKYKVNSDGSVRITTRFFNDTKQINVSYYDDYPNMVYVYPTVK